MERYDGDGQSKTEAWTNKLDALGKTEILEAQESHLQVAERNSNESPLLRIPVELRNMIYEYAIGRETYHLAPCGRSSIHKHVIVSREVLRNPPEERVDPNKLALLRVSRQIYTEAKLFPFTLGNFSFGYLNQASLLNSFSPQQRAAIVNLELETTRAVKWGQNCKKIEKASLAFLDLMPGLKRIAVLVEHSRMLQLLDMLSENYDSTEQYECRLRSWIHECYGNVEVTFRRIDKVLQNATG